MRYMRKTPVEAIQWKGDNQQEVFDFIHKALKTYHIWNDDYGNLRIAYEYVIGRRLNALVPKFGWVVREDDTFQFYKDATFRKTFEEVPDDNKGIDWEAMDKTTKEAFDGFDEVFKDFKDVFGSNPSKETLDAIRMRAYIDPNNPLAKMVDDIYSEDEKIREQVKKILSEGDTHKATFESVLGEMKELHAKKNACYGDAAHKNFLKYGPVASLSRLSEKMQRAEHILLSGKCKVKDEPLTETLIDMAITSAMLYMELKNKK